MNSLGAKFHESACVSSLAKIAILSEKCCLFTTLTHGQNEDAARR
jgi:hypothetical protein